MSDPPPTPAEADQASSTSDALGELLLRAQTGLRSQVAPLTEALEEARLLVPLRLPMPDVEVGVLRLPMPDVEVGVDIEVERELSISPHLISDAEDLGYVVAFSHADHVRPMAEQMGWDTAGGDLECCALPGRICLEMALELVDGNDVVGLLIDPMADTELMLQRHEIASLAQGKAVPLVGYVAQIPPSPDEKTLVAELDEPAPEEITRTIADAVAASPATATWKLRRTFNAERDLEPHWTLTFGAQELTDDLIALSEDIAAALEGKLPPPGYIDILFDEDLAR